MASIDVIIPMYNSEPYIPGLIRCLENQTLKDFRAVFVDDGSKDATYQMMEQALERVSFEHTLIHQENKGLPGARNTGIRNAKAEWIVFLDSDDRLDPHYLEYLLRSVTESGTDVGYCDYQTIEREEDAAPVTDYHAGVMDAQTCMKTYYQRWFGTWVLILRRSWLEGKGLLFDEACTYLEDIPFITQVIAAAEKIAVVDCPLYLYYKRPGSLMRTPKSEKYVIALEGFHRMERKVSAMDNAAAEEFRSVGRARYYLATLRRMAILMPYGQYHDLCAHIPMAEVREQVRKLQTTQRAAAQLYLTSKRLFYYAMRIMTKDN